MRLAFVFVVVSLAACAASAHRLERVFERGQELAHAPEEHPLFLYGYDEGRPAFARKLNIPVSNQFDLSKCSKDEEHKRVKCSFTKKEMSADRTKRKLSDAKYNGVIVINSHSNLGNNMVLDKNMYVGGKYVGNTLAHIGELSGVQPHTIVIFSCELGKSKKFLDAIAEALSGVSPKPKIYVTRYINNRFGGGMNFLLECCDADDPANQVPGLAIAAGAKANADPMAKLLTQDVLATVSSGPDEGKHFFATRNVSGGDQGGDEEDQEPDEED